MSTFDLARWWLAAREAAPLFGLPIRPETIREGLPEEIRAELDALPVEEQDAITSEPEDVDPLGVRRRRVLRSLGPADEREQ